ncbi:hypothetical protein B0H13DRAFT_2084087, partial [Mycena leptocephala]
MGVAARCSCRRWESWKILRVRVGRMRGVGGRGRLRRRRGGPGRAATRRRQTSRARIRAIIRARRRRLARIRATIRVRRRPRGLLRARRHRRARSRARIRLRIRGRTPTLRARAFGAPRRSCRRTTRGRWTIALLQVGSMSILGIRGRLRGGEEEDAVRGEGAWARWIWRARRRQRRPGTVRGM